MQKDPLTPENKQGLDRIPRGQKTALMNRAIANALKELEKKENAQKFIDMIAQIEPVKMALSSVEINRGVGDERNYLRPKKPRLLRSFWLHLDH